MTLETERLIIRPFRAEDGPGLYAYLSDENVVRFEPYGVFTEEAAHREAAIRAENPCFGAVCLKERGGSNDLRRSTVLIGNVYLSEQEYGAWEIGYVFNANFWGKGYATEAMRTVLDDTFRNRGAHRVVAGCDPENTASWRLLERLGLRREGHLLQNIYFKTDEKNRPLWKDSYLYGLLREEYLT